MKSKYLHTILLSIIVAWAEGIAPESADDSMITGIAQLNGREYVTVCNCETYRPTSLELVPKQPALPTKCDPSKINIIKLKSKNEGLTISDIRKIYGQPVDFEFSPIRDMFFACTDDRITDEVLSTPGGDLGSFMLGLSTAYSFNSKTMKDLDEKSVTDYLNGFLSTMPKSRTFHHCTDEDAIAHMEKSLNMEGIDLQNPTEGQQETIKKALEEPMNVGDKHFRLMAKNPSWYHIEPELPALVMKAFFNVMWSKDNENQEKVKIDVLRGKSSPKAFVEVSESDQCIQAAMATPLKPKTSISQVMVVHTTAAAQRADEYTAYFKNLVKDNFNENVLPSRNDRYGYLWLETTAEHLGRGIPYFKLNFI